MHCWFCEAHHCDVFATSNDQRRFPILVGAILFDFTQALESIGLTAWTENPASLWKSNTDSAHRHPSFLGKNMVLRGCFPYNS